MRNSWGDPVLPVYPVSRFAVWAAVAAAAAAISMLLLCAGHENAGLLGFSPTQIVLLGALQVMATVVGLDLAYIALLTCPIDDPRPGRGLAWAALACSLLSMISIVAMLAMLAPIFQYLLYVVAVVAFLHLFAFAAESKFARYAVTCSLIGAVFLALVSAYLVQSRERSRQRLAEKNLQEIGLQMGALMETQDHARGFQSVLSPDSQTMGPYPPLPVASAGSPAWITNDQAANELGGSQSVYQAELQGVPHSFAQPQSAAENQPAVWMGGWSLVPGEGASGLSLEGQGGAERAGQP